MYIIFIIAFLFIALAGLFDAAQTARRDLVHDSTLWEWMRTDKEKAWYDALGMNEIWNPSLPSIPWLNWWNADFWHSCKFGWIAMYACAIATLAAGYFDGWVSRVIVWLSAFVIAYGTEGNSFRIGYGNLFRKNPSETILEILFDINPFKNTHKKVTP